MLQQTTVAAVVPYFERFTNRFPTVFDLASADEEEVLRHWEGLGYYSRARNLHKAAVQIVNELDGEFPVSAEDLQQLPGIGPYTAGAISSFAFNQPAAILEANTLRLFSRLIELNIDPRGSKGQKALWSFARWIVSRKRAADFNQAVMDIGSQVCRPTDPDCLNCPLMPSCKSFESGRQHEIPLEKKKTEITDVTEVSLAIRKNGQFLVRRRSEGERWAGLWDFVRFEVPDRDVRGVKFQNRRRNKTETDRRQRSLFGEESSAVPLPNSISEKVNSLTGLRVSRFEPITEIRHAVTRYRIRLLCLVCDCEDGRIVQGSGFEWASRRKLNDLPLSKTGRSFAELLQEL